MDLQPNFEMVISMAPDAFKKFRVQKCFGAAMSLGLVSCSSSLYVCNVCIIICRHVANEK